MLKAIIFDLDGVLVDSVTYGWESFSILLKDHGIHFSGDYIKKHLGTSLRDKLDLWKKDFGIDLDLQEFNKKSLEIQFQLMKDELKPNSFITELLNNALKKNIKLGVSTTSMKHRAEKILEMLEIRDKFQTVMAGEDVEKHKPSPDSYLETARKLEVKPTECVVVEDSLIGIKAAKSAKMKVVALVTKYYNAEELKEADLIINSLSELSVERLKALFS